MPDPEDSDVANHRDRERAEACMKLLLERFPHVQALVVKRCERLESFRELCEEYWACSEVLARLEALGPELESALERWMELDERA